MVYIYMVYIYIRGYTGVYEGIRWYTGYPRGLWAKIIQHRTL